MFLQFVPITGRNWGYKLQLPLCERNKSIFKLYSQAITIYSSQSLNLGPVWHSGTAAPQLHLRRKFLLFYRCGAAALWQRSAKWAIQLVLVAKLTICQKQLQSLLRLKGRYIKDASCKLQIPLVNIQTPLGSVESFIHHIRNLTKSQLTSAPQFFQDYMLNHLKEMEIFYLYTSIISETKQLLQARSCWP